MESGNSNTKQMASEAIGERQVFFVAKLFQALGSA